MKRLALLMLTMISSLAFGEPGGDVRAAFARAAAGEPLRYVAMGGSITQSGEGWIGSWLREQFPRSAVSVTNAGWSATGSELGIFRVERDVMTHAPDLVAIEFAVNDTGLSDENAVRYMESLVVRLKRMKDPPAIVILEAATRTGVKLQRHRRVARHYGLAEVDLQAAVDADLAGRKLPWETYFRDEVHPNDAGKAFYARIIARTLQPFVDQAKRAPEAAWTDAPLPPPLSAKPLLLDGKMVPLSTLSAPGWTWENSAPFWWSRWFLGFLNAGAPGSALVLPFRGSAIGILFGMNTDYGLFLAGVDGAFPKMIAANYRIGSGYEILGMDLPATGHLLDLVIPAWNQPGAGPVKLGYALVAGGSAASAEQAEQGAFSVEKLRTLAFTDVPASAWSRSAFSPVSNPAVKDGRAVIESLPPEKPDAEWIPAPAQDAAWIDLRTLLGDDRPGAMRLRAEIESDAEEAVVLAVSADYFVQIRLNGEVVDGLTGLKGHPKNPRLLPVTLRPGKNRIVLGLGSGGKGFGFSLAVGRFRESDPPRGQ